MRYWLCCLATCLIGGTTLAGPSVTIVVGEKVSPLERYAASELDSLLKRLFDANTTIQNKSPDKAEHVILLGNPDTNPNIKPLVGDTWAKLSDQGHLLRTVERQGKPQLIVGGGSPLATLWAVYEFGHRFGMRYLPEGDYLPARDRKLSLRDIDLVLEPTIRVRAWRTLGDSPISLVSWSLDEQKRLLKQLVKLKFNHVLLEMQPWQPFARAHLGVRKENHADLWRGGALKVDGDTAGRLAFRGATVFDNADLLKAKTLADRRKAAIELARGIIDQAHELGMTTGLAINPLNVEREGQVSETVQMQMARARILAYVQTYPKIDTLELAVPSSSVGTKLARRLLSTKELFNKENGGSIEPILIYQTMDESPGSSKYGIRAGTNLASLAKLNILDKEVSKKDHRFLILPIGNNTVLSYQGLSQLEQITDSLRKGHWHGISVESAAPGGVASSLYYLSRAAFDRKMTPKNAMRELYGAICGDGVVDRLAMGFDMIEQASSLLSADSIGVLQPDMLLKQYMAKEPPASWKQARKLYAGAMDEMYRAQQRAPGRVRPMLVYHAKRLEFTLGYLDCLDALRQAGLARSRSDKDKQIEHLEKATESIYNGLSAYAEVARDSSDRGVIASLNNIGYRNLKKELEKAESNP